MRKKKVLKVLNKDYDEASEKRTRLDYVRNFFEIKEKKDYTIDDETWNDMDMDNIYKKLNKNNSSLGESVLYYMLRNPLNNEDDLKSRGDMINSIKNNIKLREKLLYIFFQLGIDPKNSFLEMMESELIVNKFKYYLYTFLGKIFPLISIIAIVLLGESYAPLIFVSTSINLIVNFIEKNNIKSRGIIYLRGILKASKKVCNLKDKEIKYYIDNISSNIKQIKDIDRSTFLIGIVNMWQGIFEVISVLFLVEECAYYNISMLLKDKKEYIINLFYYLGELEANLSIACYQESLKHQYVKPNFIKDVSLKIVDGIHPLLDNPVPNSIFIKNKGIILTGTNMSGKSTFLRMLCVNIILAQTFYFVLAKNYTASFFNVVSSISPNDDLSKGKSYYMAEAEGILRIFKAIKKDLPVFCPIDEIFRGTNPIERIAMSAEILTYLNNERTIPIAATHDRELVNVLKDIYEFYYFSEDIKKNEGLNFDYKLKTGVSKTKNAIRLLEYIGYPKTITEKAYKRAETIKDFI